MREMSNWSAMVSSTTESSDSFRDVSIASSFCACGTVRGNPSSTKLHQKTERKKKRQNTTRSTAAGDTYPFLHCLLFSSWSRIIPTMISSETSPPASMIFFASTPSDVFFDTCSRSMSPVARWHTQNSSRIRGACVPFPVYTRNNYFFLKKSASEIIRREEGTEKRTHLRLGAQRGSSGVVALALLASLQKLLPRAP